ncbi:MAG: hypothetical protein QG591_802, partial [Planctomycetota bacterium]|nr:hypothetical protein [Planctomycetota bacterium]
MMNDKIVGHVVGVHGFCVKVELASEIKSPVRAHLSNLQGASLAISINAYLSFSIGAGQYAIGIVTDLDARDSYEPTNEELSLELTRPRRVATIQLLGTLKPVFRSESYRFDPGISILPTLDTPAEIAEKYLLDALFDDAPKRNKPEDHPDGEPFDSGLRIGIAIALGNQIVKGSFNDLFSRPLTIVGNTGSGKSNTVSHLIQQSQKDRITNRPKVFILDINGEYASAFEKSEPDGGRMPNHLYVNGKEFGLPVWLMNTHEACVWLSVAEQTQQPALINLWSIAKGGKAEPSIRENNVREVILKITQLLNTLDDDRAINKGKDCNLIGLTLSAYAQLLTLDSNDKKILDEIIKTIKKYDKNYTKSLGSDEPLVKKHLQTLQSNILLKTSTPDASLVQQSADKPIYFGLNYLQNPSELHKAASVEEGDQSFRQFLRGLQLRIGNRLRDQRWHCFLNYNKLGINSFRDWLEKLGIGSKTEGTKGNDVCVIDCSMIDYEVIPYVCGIIGRLLLELREHVPSKIRFHEPWVTVLEETHNYVCPVRQNESRGLSVSREAFERIAKEGRKFGLSLI